MSTLKPQKKQTNKDWHPADVVAALHKAGWSLRQLSLQCNYSEGTLRKALRFGWPKAERIIATALGLKPEEIWPERCASRNHSPKLTPALRAACQHRQAA
jgi:Ner family transcriptional regulator